MPYEFIQILANGQGSGKEELNKLLRGGRIASVKKEFFQSPWDTDAQCAGHHPTATDATPLGLVFNLATYPRVAAVPQPKVGLRHEGLPWDTMPPPISTPTGLCPACAVRP